MENPSTKWRFKVSVCSFQGGEKTPAWRIPPLSFSNGTYKFHNLFTKKIQVPKMEVLNRIGLFWGWVFPYISQRRWGFLHCRYLTCLVICNVINFPIRRLDCWKGKLETFSQEIGNPLSSWSSAKNARRNCIASPTAKKICRSTP